MALSQDLIEILVCPQCKGDLRHIEEPEALVCEPCRLRYPVKEDIPIMLIEEAERLP
jgi:uncharacterized protein YbaR (Trm112 family)